uniref:Ribosomal protein n=1 Tax=Syphacia muris TaxID=451379 RepID=A0A0N5AVZ8_9BILA
MIICKSLSNDLLNSSLPLASLFKISAVDSLFPIQYQQCRGRKRNLKIGLSKAEKAARREAREAKEAERKKYNFMERTQIRRMKSLLSPSEQYPGRYSIEAEESLPDRPTTNVFICSAVKTQFFDIPDALDLYSLSKYIVKGQFRIDDYDFCVAHSDMANYISPLRGVLRTKCPTRANGALGDDLESLIGKFKNGVKLSIQGDPIHPTWGLCNIMVGKLSMTNDQIEANIGALVAALCKHRNPALGDFINRAVLLALPSQSYFAMNLKAFVPAVTEADEQKVIKKYFIVECGR